MRKSFPLPEKNKNKIPLSFGHGRRQRRSSTIITIVQEPAAHGTSVFFVPKRRGGGWLGRKKTQVACWCGHDAFASKQQQQVVRSNPSSFSCLLLDSSNITLVPWRVVTMHFALELVLSTTLAQACALHLPSTNPC